jgi:hypothetical protein
MTVDSISAIVRMGSDSLNAVICLPTKGDSKLIDSLINGGFALVFTLVGSIATLVITNILEKQKSKSQINSEIAIKRIENLIKIIREYRYKTRTLFRIEHDYPDMEWHDAKMQFMMQIKNIIEFLEIFQIEHGSYLDDTVNEQIDSILSLSNNAKSDIDDKLFNDGDTFDVYHEALSDVSSKYGGEIYDKRSSILNQMQAQLKRHMVGDH